MPENIVDCVITSLLMGNKEGYKNSQQIGQEKFLFYSFSLLPLKLHPLSQWASVNL